MEVSRLERHIRDHRNKRMEETSRRQKRMEAFSEEGQGSEKGCGAIKGMEWKLCSIMIRDQSQTGLHDWRSRN